MRHIYPTTSPYGYSPPPCSPVIGGEQPSPKEESRLLQFVIGSNAKNLPLVFVNGRCFTSVQHDSMIAVFAF